MVACWAIYVLYQVQIQLPVDTNIFCIRSVDGEQNHGAEWRNDNLINFFFCPITIDSASVVNLSRMR